MKIRIRELPLEDVMALDTEKHVRPVRPSILLHTILQSICAVMLKKANYSSEKIHMERLQKHEPAFYLMNHSNLLDFFIAERAIYPRPFSTICSYDSFIGKSGLLRRLGCIPAKRFVADLSLIHDINYTVHKLHNSILMYPEAGFSFDGPSRALPTSLGGFVKQLKLPVIMIRTNGVFNRSPLYNNFQVRDVPVHASIEYLLSPQDLETLSAEEINAVLKEQFTFDNFRWQQQNHIRIAEPFRADGLNHILYKCPACQTEFQMEGDGIHLSCQHCRKQWTLTEEGFLQTTDGEHFFTHVPDWYAWERECARNDLLFGTYSLDLDVKLYIQVDTKYLYSVGNGHLHHDYDGFVLTDTTGRLLYTHSPSQNYSLCSTFNWNEMGEVICIGDSNIQYYCLPLVAKDIAIKTLFIAEELYSLMNSLQKDFTP